MGSASFLTKLLMFVLLMTTFVQLGAYAMENCPFFINFVAKGVLGGWNSKKLVILTIVGLFSLQYLLIWRPFLIGF